MKRYTSEDLVNRRDSFVGSVRHVNGLNGAVRVPDAQTAQAGTWEIAMPNVPRTEAARVVAEELSSFPRASRTPSWAVMIVREYASGVIEGLPGRSAVAVRLFAIRLQAYLRASVQSLHGNFSGLATGLNLGELLGLFVQADGRRRSKVIRIAELLEKPRTSIKWRWWLSEFLNALPDLIALIDEIESRTGFKFELAYE